MSRAHFRLWLFSLLCLLIISCNESKKNTTAPSVERQNEFQVRRVTRTNSSVQLLSDIQTVDRIYPSMTGPIWSHQFSLLESKQPELLWIQSIRSEVTEADGETVASEQYVCHANFDSEQPPKIFAGGRRDPRVFTLSQGLLNLSLPRGFGIPVLSNEPFRMATQTLNLHQNSGVEKLRHRTRIEFLRDKDRQNEIIPLTYRSLTVQVSMTGESMVYEVLTPNPLQRKARCLPGEDANQGNEEHRDRHGRRFSGHWMVPPGRHSYRTLATPQLALDEDTVVHAAAAHLHPYAESISLHDLSSGKIIYQASAENFKDTVGLKNIDTYSDSKGFVLSADGEYELVTTYNNTTPKKVDAMAVLYLYMRDKKYVMPTKGEIKAQLKRQASSRPAVQPVR